MDFPKRCPIFVVYDLVVIRQQGGALFISKMCMIDGSVAMRASIEHEDLYIWFGPAGSRIVRICQSHLM